MTNAAPVGKRCDRCLCCPAVIVSESEALCSACDDGTHPSMPEGQPTPQKPESVPETPLAVPAPVPVPKPERKDAMSIRSGRGPGKRIDLETRRAVLAADPEISHSQLARELGISDPSVKNIRMRAHAAAAPTAEEPAWVPEPAGETARAATVHLSVTETRMDAWWKSLSLDDKAALLTANYRFRIEGSVL
jgi:hypothetical protein